MFYTDSQGRQTYTAAAWRWFTSYPVSCLIVLRNSQNRAVTAYNGNDYFRTVDSDLKPIALYHSFNDSGSLPAVGTQISSGGATNLYLRNWTPHMHLRYDDAQITSSLVNLVANTDSSVSISDMVRIDASFVKSLTLQWFVSAQDPPFEFGTNNFYATVDWAYNSSSSATPKSLLNAGVNNYRILNNAWSSKFSDPYAVARGEHTFSMDSPSARYLYFSLPRFYIKNGSAATARFRICSIGATFHAVLK